MTDGIKKLIVAILIAGFAGSLHAQELQCNIQIVTSKLQGTNKQIFQTLQNAIFEFMNTRKWTSHKFSNEERIECNMLININEQISSDEFKGTIQIQSRRPVYNTSYNTTLFNYKDDNFHIRYVEYEPLEFNESSHISNLTSILAFYAYVILGLDYDSFSMKGGTPFFKKAETIVNNAKSAQESGWQSYESDDNRYWLIENIMNEKFSPLREFIYAYHRMGLDVMHNKTAQGRETIAESLKLLQEVYREKPSMHMPFYDIIFDAKSNELVNVFSESFPQEQTMVVNILSEIDPANSDKYKKITQKNDSG